jgi:hypothetical protein
MVFEGIIEIFLLNSAKKAIKSVGFIFVVQMMPS